MAYCLLLQDCRLGVADLPPPVVSFFHHGHSGNVRGGLTPYIVASSTKPSLAGLAGQNTLQLASDP